MGNLSTGRLAIAHPRLVICAWIGLTLLSASVVPALLDGLSNRGLGVTGSDSHRAAHTLIDHVPGYAGTGMYAVVGAQGPRDINGLMAAHRRGSREAIARLRRIPDVSSVRQVTVRIQTDKGTGFPERALSIVSLRLDLAPSRAELRMDDLRAALGSPSHRGITTALVGGPPASAQYSEIAKHDLARAEQLALPLMLAVLLVAFLSVVAAALPVLLAVITSAVVFGLLYLLNLQLGLSAFVTNTATALALGLSIDFSLFVVMRFREELRRTADVEAAVAATMATAGRTVLLSGLTIAASVSSLFAVGIVMFSSMAVGAILATLVAVLAATTLLPAILCLLGTRIDRLGLARAARAAEHATLWHRIAGVVTRRPVAAAAISAGTLALLAVPALSLQTDLNVIAALPHDDPIVEEAHGLTATFGAGAIGPVDVATQRAPRAAANLIRRDPDVRSVWTTTPGRSGWSALRVVLESSPDSQRAWRTVRRLRAKLADGPTTHVGGVTATTVDLTDRVDERTPYVVLIAIVIAIVLLGFGLRSIVVPLKAVLGSLLSVGATLGVLLTVLPSGSGDATLEFFVPLFLFAVVFGLSIDYELFLLSRVKESVAAGRPIRDAVTDGLVHSARTITLAGLALTTVFVAFSTSSLDAFRQLGLGVAIAVVLDVTLVRCLFVPASMVLLGKWNWWLPGRAKPPT